MSDREPTPEQWRAIRAEGSVAVRAGAGSGKTTVLAHHFLYLLRPRPEAPPLIDEVGRILAITFTEKAAAEMKQKIHTLLAVELGRATGTERRHWERVRRELLAARVGVWLAAAMEHQEALAPVATAALREAAERIAARLRSALGAARDTPTVARLRAAWPPYEAMLEEIGRGGAAAPVLETGRLE